MITITRHDEVLFAEFPINFKYDDYISIHKYLTDHAWILKDEFIDIDSAHYRSYEINGVKIILAFDHLYGIHLYPHNKDKLQTTNLIIENVCDELEREFQK